MTVRINYIENYKHISTKNRKFAFHYLLFLVKGQQ
jgi:hypothetical protein